MCAHNFICKNRPSCWLSYKPFSLFAAFRWFVCKFNYSLIQFMCFHPPSHFFFLPLLGLVSFFCYLGLIFAHIRENNFSICCVCAFLNFSPQINFQHIKFCFLFICYNLRIRMDGGEFIKNSRAHGS